MNTLEKFIQAGVWTIVFAYIGIATASIALPLLYIITRP